MKNYRSLLFALSGLLISTAYAQTKTLAKSMRVYRFTDQIHSQMLVESGNLGSDGSFTALTTKTLSYTNVPGIDSTVLKAVAGRTVIDREDWNDPTFGLAARNPTLDYSAFTVGGGSGYWYTVDVAASTPAVVPSTGSTTGARLKNISARSFVGTDANVQIAGIIISGSMPKKVLIRASGPQLTQYGVSGVLADPMLSIVNSSGTEVAKNDDWDSANAVDFSAAGAAPWTAGSKDAAVVVTLPPGNYTAVVSGKNGGSGVALVEVFEMDTASKLVNISARALVKTDGDVLIGGFIIAGDSPKKVLIRASGPSLSQYGVTGVLADPLLSVVNSAGTEVAKNDDWDVANTQAFQAAGAAAWTAGTKDAAVVVTLDPGSYTAVISGKNSSTGVALMEVFEMP